MFHQQSAISKLAPGHSLLGYSHIKCLSTQTAASFLHCLQRTMMVDAPFMNTSNDGRMLDIMVNATLSAPSMGSGNDTFMTGVRLTHDPTTYTNVMLNGTITLANSSSWLVESLGVYVDRQMSGGATNTTYQVGALTPAMHVLLSPPAVLHIPLPCVCGCNLCHACSAASHVGRS